MIIKAKLAHTPIIQATLSTKAIKATLTGKINSGEGLPVYTDKYTIIPSQLAQTLNTKDKTMRENIVIAPIPNNYGLVTYNGFDLRIS